MAYTEDTKCRFYDVGGGFKIRDIWNNYYHDVHGIIFVVDSSDKERYPESMKLLHSVLQHEYLKGKPILIFCNKQDQPHCLSASEIKMELINTYGHVEFEQTVMVLPSVIDPQLTHNQSIDPQVESGIEWLFKNIIAHYENLDHRVMEDTKDVERKFEEERTRKEADVLKGLLSRVFLKKNLDETEGKVEDDDIDCFTKSEGLNFLAEEVGLSKPTNMVDSEDVKNIEEGVHSTNKDFSHIPIQAKQIAWLVGYQKLALQMVGNMFAPITKKRRAMTWKEIKERIVGVRQELGILEKVEDVDIEADTSPIAVGA